MSFANEIHITGRIATAPAQIGSGPVRFRLSHGGGGKRKNGEPWPVQFFTVISWNRKSLQELRKGLRVEIFGELRDASYVKDGVARTAVEIVAENIVSQPEDQPKPPITPNIHGVPITDEDIPF